MTLLTLLLALAIEGGLCSNNTFGGDTVEIGIEQECFNSRFNAVKLSEPISSLIYCTDENGFCSFIGTKTVTYGVLGVATVEAIFKDGVDCNNQVFGDPIHGTVKKCYYTDMKMVSAFDYPCVNYTGPFKEFTDFGLSEDSPAIGAGTEIAGFTCPFPGHPGNGECLEWFNVPGPDIGACQAVYLSRNIAIEIIE